MNHPPFDMDCRYCGMRLQCPKDSDGKKIRCPKCGSAMMVDTYKESDELETQDPMLPTEEKDQTEI